MVGKCPNYPPFFLFSYVDEEGGSFQEGFWRHWEGEVFGRG